jgi:hypothetical protein
MKSEGFKPIFKLPDAMCDGFFNSPYEACIKVLADTDFSENSRRSEKVFYGVG